MSNIYTWSQTAADNDDADSGINWAEFQDPDTVNNSARAMMARQAALVADMMPTRTSGGTANSYTVTSAAAPSSFTSDFLVLFKADKTNSGSSTITVNALAAKPLRAKTGTALTAGDIQAGTIVAAYYSQSADEFLIVNSGFHANALLPTVASAYAVGVKVGMMLDYGGTSLPAGYIWADGSAVSRTTYAELFAAYGTTYGAGDGSTTFNVPDRRGRASFGKDNMGGSAADRITSAKSGITGTTLGASGGLESTLMARANLPNVTLTVTGDVNSSASPSTWFRDPGTQGVETGPANASDIGSNVTLNINSSFTNGVTSSLNGGVTQTEMNNMPPALVCNVIILALPAAANAAALGTNGAPYRFNTSTTAADPGSGYLAYDNATVASATTLYISETGANSEALSAYLDTWDDSSSGTKGRLHIYQIGAVGTFAMFNVTGSVTDSGSYKTITISHVTSTGTFSSGAEISVLFTATGDSGDAATYALWDAKGDLAVATGPNTATRLPVGTNGQTLVADSAEATGMKWATNSGTGDALTANPLSQFAATTSLQLKGVISDETGSGALVFATSPTLVTPALGTPSSGTLTNCTGLPTAGHLDDSVTFAKIQNVAANSVLARAANSSGDVSEVALSASQLLGRGSTGDVAALTLGPSLALSGTTLHGGTTVMPPLTSITNLKGGPTNIVSSLAVGAMVADRLYLTRLYVGRATTLAELGIRVTTGSGAATTGRLGLYNANTNGTPGTLIVDAGTILTDATGYISATISQALVPGVGYWLAATFESTPSVIQFANNAINGAAIGFDSSLTTASYRSALYRAKTYGPLGADETGNTYTFGAVTIPLVMWDE